MVQQDYFSQFQNETIQIEIKFVTGSGKTVLDLSNLVDIYAHADLIFIMNEHDHINVNAFLTIGRLCELYRRAASGIICLQESNPEGTFEQSEEYVTVSHFNPHRHIPKTRLYGQWYNCGPEWVNPIILRPSIPFHNSTLVRPFPVPSDQYVRYFTLPESEYPNPKTPVFPVTTSETTLKAIEVTISRLKQKRTIYPSSIRPRTNSRPLLSMMNR